MSVLAAQEAHFQGVVVLNGILYRPKGFNCIDLFANIL